MTLDNSNITYERLLFSQAGQEVEGAGLDINTGVFTAPYSAVWTVSYSATSVQYSGDIIQATQTPLSLSLVHHLVSVGFCRSTYNLTHLLAVAL